MFILNSYSSKGSTKLPVFLKFVSGCLAVGLSAVAVEAAEIEALRDRLSGLTPEVQTLRELSPGLRFVGYTLDSSTGDSANVIQLDVSQRFGITLYFEQRTVQANQYQILLQASDIRFDERTGLSFSPKEEDSEMLRRRLPVDLTRGSIQTEAGQAGGVLKLKMEVSVPRYLAELGETELKMLVILPNGEMSDSQHLDVFRLTDSTRSSGMAGDRLSVAPSPGNLLGNASFEDEPYVNSKGNWTFWNTRGVMQFLDRSVSAHGVRSLRFDFFGGMNVHMYSSHQKVSVKPNTTYKLSWYAKSAGLTSRAGPTMSVWDADNGWKHFVINGERITGDTPWRQYQYQFRTPADTSKIQIVFDRPGSGDWKALPMPERTIVGSAWFDLIELVEVK